MRVEKQCRVDLTGLSREIKVIELIEAGLLIRDDVKIVQLVRARTVDFEVVGSTPAKTPKTENSNVPGFELHRPSSKGTKLLFRVIKAMINQCKPDNASPSHPPLNTLPDSDSVSLPPQYDCDRGDNSFKSSTDELTAFPSPPLCHETLYEGGLV